MTLAAASNKDNWTPRYCACVKHCISTKRKWRHFGGRSSTKRVPNWHQSSETSNHLIVRVNRIFLAAWQTQAAKYVVGSTTLHTLDVDSTPARSKSSRVTATARRLWFQSIYLLLSTPSGVCSTFGQMRGNSFNVSGILPESGLKEKPWEKPLAPSNQASQLTSSWVANFKTCFLQSLEIGELLLNTNWTSRKSSAFDYFAQCSKSFQIHYCMDVHVNICVSWCAYNLTNGFLWHAQWNVCSSAQLRNDSRCRWNDNYH